MAVISDSIVFIGQNITSILILYVVVHLTRNYLTPGASAIPGPFLAKISNIWRFVDVATGHAEVTLSELHRKYGDYVRLGPKVVSVRDLDAIKIIYGINKGYDKVSRGHPLSISHVKLIVSFKTDFYKVQQQLAKGKPTPTLFTTTDEGFHAAIKRPISAAYSMSTMTEFEPFVDKTIYTFFERLDGFVDRHEVCEIATWLQYCMSHDATTFVCQPLT